MAPLFEPYKAQALALLEKDFAGLPLCGIKDPRATRLPALPVLERLLERGLVWGTALLIGGLATGGAAMRVSLTFRILHPTALLGLVEVGLLVAVLAMHRTRSLSRRALALTAMACLAIALLGTLSLVVSAHG